MENLINKINLGDCLEVMRLIPDKSIDCIICDIPYGTTACSWDIVIPFDKMWEQLNRIIKNNGAIALFGSEPFSSYLRMGNINNFKYDWIWEKQKASNFMGARYSPLKYHEIISVFSNDTHNYYPQKYKVLEFEDIISMDKKELRNIFETKQYDRYATVDKRININNQINNKECIGIKIKRTRKADDGFRNPKSIIKINKDVQNNIHPTQKSIALYEYLIKTYTKENEIVLDFCSGSGTNALACINTNRNFICIEKDSDYFKSSCERLNNFKKQMTFNF